MRDLPDSVLPPEPRRYAGVNWIGLQALYAKEVRRFWKVGLQTVGAPVLTSLLYMLVFSVATSGARPQVNGVSFLAFVAPGLIMMTILNNAFANSSSSILQSKINVTRDAFDRTYQKHLVEDKMWAIDSHAILQSLPGALGSRNPIRFHTHAATYPWRSHALWWAAPIPNGASG